MARFLPSIILAVVGAAAYAIGCILFLEQRRQKARGEPNRTLLIYAAAMMVLGVFALGVGLYRLEISQFHVMGG
jgi:uncharacterized membrane protein YidH (DUF202 family)